MTDLDLDSLQLAMPLAAGGLIVVATLLIALFRGMSAGIIVALLIGSTMLIAPILLAGANSGGLALAQATAETAESAATLARDNRNILRDMERALRSGAAAVEATYRDTLGDREAAPATIEALARAREQLDILGDGVAAGEAMVRTVESDIEALQIEMRRANFLRRRADALTR